MTRAYYNEIDPYAAQWLRNLIVSGHIAPGDVDERSIEDVRPDELDGYAQCHFFAGVGVWSLALRRAGWPDDRPVWTGSCPCQPFSAAGKGNGFDDDRHLWPHFQWLIQQCQPSVVFGEQVASKATEPWIDLVHADLEAMGYAFGCVPFPSAGVGAPHIRDRAYWVARATDQRQHRGWSGKARDGRNEAWREPKRFCDAGRLHSNGRISRGEAQPFCAEPDAEHGCTVNGLADAKSRRRREECTDGGRLTAGDRAQGVAAGLVHGGRDCRSVPPHGPWSDADWICFRDGKWRPVEPGTFPLAHGAPSRVGRLCAYGNAINAYQAQIFIEAAMDSEWWKKT